MNYLIFWASFNLSSADPPIWYIISSLLWEVGIPRLPPPYLIVSLIFFPRNSTELVHIFVLVHEVVLRAEELLSLATRYYSRGGLQVDWGHYLSLYLVILHRCSHRRLERNRFSFSTILGRPQITQLTRLSSNRPSLKHVGQLNRWGAPIYLSLSREPATYLTRLNLWMHAMRRDWHISVSSLLLSCSISGPFAFFLPYSSFQLDTPLYLFLGAPFTLHSSPSPTPKHPFTEIHPDKEGLCIYFMGML